MVADHRMINMTLGSGGDFIFSGDSGGDRSPVNPFR